MLSGPGVIPVLTVLYELLVLPATPVMSAHPRPRTRRPVIDRLGMITVQRCKNSAPAGFEFHRRWVIAHGRHAMLVLKAHVSLAASSDINAGSEVAEHGAVPTSGDFAMLHRTGQRPATAGLWLRGREQRNSLVKIMLRLGVKAGAADGGTRTCFSGAWACGISVAASIRRSTSCLCLPPTTRRPLELWRSQLFL